jgi:DNA-binding transcriptional LysR family regulator
VASFAVAFPNVTLEIGTYDGVVDLIRDPCDVAVLLRAPPDSRLIRKRLATLRRGIYAAPSYLERHGLPETLEGLSLHRCIVTELQREERIWTFSRQRRRRSVETQWRAVVSSIGMLRELVLGGAGIGMLNEILCRNDIRTGRLVRVLPDWDGPPLHATAVLPSRHLVPRRSRVFLDFISRELGRGEGRGS